MSYFNFIASDYEMPGVDNTDKHRMTVKKAVDRGLMTNEYDLPLASEVLIYETEEEFDARIEEYVEMEEQEAGLINAIEEERDEENNL